MSGPIHLPVVRASEPAACATAATSGLVPALIAEIAERLGQLLEGTASAIDLGSLPLTGGDHDELSRLLGRGEIAMSLALASEGELWETAYPGVWRVRYRNRAGELIGDFIELTTIPRIAVAPLDDVRHSQRRLARWVDDEHGRLAAR
jgi:hydrogenase-1 operon protein HyaF